MTRTFELSKPLVEYGNTLREWSMDQVRPYARQADTDHKPPANWLEIMESCPVPIGSPYVRGGEPIPTFDEGYWVSDLVVYESLMYGDIWPAPKLSGGIGHLVVDQMGTPEQKAKWYTPIVDGSETVITAFALTEPGFGTDTSRVATTAVLDGDEWVLNGNKIYCTQGSECVWAVVFATVDKSLGAKGINAFVVPADNPGFKIVKNEKKLGIRSWSTTELLIDNCRVPKANRLGYDEDGNRVSERGGQSGALGALANNRPNMSMMAIGMAAASLDITEGILKERKAGFSLQRWAAIESDIAQMRHALDRSRRICFDAQFAVDQGRTERASAAAGKAYPPQTGERIIRRCMQLLGPEGESTDLLLEKWYRDTKIMDIFEGSGQAQRLIVARTMMGKPVG